MDKHIQAAKAYFAQGSRKELLIGIAALVLFVVLIVAVVQLVRQSGPKFDYDPADACGMLTKEEAGEMLGSQVLHDSSNDAKLSVDGNTATSKCSYTDANPDAAQMKVAALAVRSGINDKGVQQNKAEFATGAAASDVEIVQNLGDRAYFDHERGQLNMLKGREWYILSYGAGAEPTANTINDSVELAYKVLSSESQLPTF